MGKAGATVPQTDCHDSNGNGMPPHSWSHVNAATFNVRQGPDYLLHKRKSFSLGPSFYELLGMDWYKSGQRLEGVSELAELPGVAYSHPLVPSLLVVNVQLPLEGPNLLKGAKEDGPTVHAVFYFGLREGTVRALNNLESAEPSVRLLANYFRQAESEPAMRKRFKALAVVNNLDIVKMHRLITPFNGKPVLITESGSLMRGVRTPEGEGNFGEARGVEGTQNVVPGAESGAISDGSGANADSSIEGPSSRKLESGFFGDNHFLEMDINVRKWSYLARKGLHKLKSKFGSVNVSVAFVIEGRDDSELPEQVLGCALINMLEIDRAREINAS